MGQMISGLRPLIVPEELLVSEDDAQIQELKNKIHGLNMTIGRLKKKIEKLQENGNE